MRRSIALILGTGLLLSACSNEPAATPVKTLTLQENLQNPLFAERYWTELTDRMVTLTINKDPIIKDSRKNKVMNDLRLSGVEKAKAATALRTAGWSAPFLSISELTQGITLLKDNTLHFSTDFVTYPGADLRIYLTSVIDPRDAAFPDPTAIDLGLLQSPYGAQSYVITADAEALAKSHTVVLLDKELGRIIAFAQLSH